MKTIQYKGSNDSKQEMLDKGTVRLLRNDESERSGFRDLMRSHHYLKSDVLLGEQLRYMAEIDGKWGALLSWSAAAKSLREREK